MGGLTLFIFGIAMLVLSVSAELQHRQQENFHYSSSSKKMVNGNVVDEDDKTGYHRKQTGNMGGNYDESENMDAEARRKMDDMLRLSREGMMSHPLGVAPALGPMGIPVFMTNTHASGSQALRSGALSSGALVVDDCDVLGSASSHQHHNHNAAASQYSRTGTIMTPVVQPIVHRSESASQYSARSETGSRVAPVAAVLVPVSSGSMHAVDTERYRDANRRVYGSAVAVRPVTTVDDVQRQVAQDRYVASASETRRHPVVYQPSAHTIQTQQQAAAAQQQYSSASQVVEPQRSYPVSYTSGSQAAQSASQHQAHASQYHGQEHRRYDTTHDDIDRRGVPAYVAPAQTDVLHASESQRYGSSDYERRYQQPAVTIRPGGKSDIDRHIENLDRTVERFRGQSGGYVADRNRIVTPRPVTVDMDYDEDQQQVQQTFSASEAAAASSYAQQSSRDVLRGGAGSQRVAGYDSGSRHQPGYGSAYDAAGRRGMLQSASSVQETRVPYPERNYQQVDRQSVDRSTYATAGRRGNAEELGQEATDLLGAAGAMKPGGSYRQEKDDSMSYGYHDAGTFGAERTDGLRGTYAKDGSVAATSRKAEDMHEENGRVRFAAESSYSKHQEHSERRSFDMPAGSAVNQVSQAELDRMTPEQRKAYWDQFGQRFNEFASKLYKQHGY